MIFLHEARRLIAESRLFDADWYRSAHPDVPDDDPVLDFLRHGRALERAPGPHFDTGFCLRTYADLAASAENPLVAFLLCADRERRPTTERQLRQFVDQEREAAAALRGGREPDRAISYGLLAQQLTSDLMRGLRLCLDAHARHAAEVEFLVADASSGPDLRQGLETEFPAVLDSGLLRILASPGVPQAPTRDDFRRHMRGEVFSALRAGDVVTTDQTLRLMRLAHDHPEGFLFHPFGGTGSDGSGHRISTSGWIYANIRPDRGLLPLHAGGTELVLAVLRRYPAVPFLGVDKERTIFTQSPMHREAITLQPLANRQIFLDDWPQLPPLSPVPPDAHLAHEVDEFNAAVAVMAQVSGPALRQEVLHKLNRHKMRIIETVPRDAVMGMLFAGQHDNLPPPVPQNDISLFACVRDEGPFLEQLVPHYRALGVKRFFIVDDGSATPVEALHLGRDVAVFRPTAGTFRTSKTLWLETLMKLFLPEGAWTVTVDADEFLHLPAPWASLQALATALGEDGREHAAGVLLDMLPAPGGDPKSWAADAGDFRSVFTHFLSDPAVPAEDYLSDPAVQWGFGPYAPLSWRFDARHRLFGTVDSLRKIPFFRYRQDRHPNQGFHTFDYLDPQRMPGHEIWEQEPVLPILHYKLVKLFETGARMSMLERADAYHARTQENIIGSFGAGGDDLHIRLARLQGCLRPLTEADDVTRAFAGACPAGAAGVPPPRGARGRALLRFRQLAILAATGLGRFNNRQGPGR